MTFNVAQNETLTPVNMSRRELEYALEHNTEFFIEFNLGDELTYPVPHFHKVSFSLLISSSVARVALALPRGHAKTTLAKLACLWYFLFTDIRFIVYVSNTATIAQAACADIINYMQTANFIAVFGRVEWIKNQGGDGFYWFKLRGKSCILRALGAGQQVRGINIDNRRPELAVVDDLEDDDNTATKYLRDRLKEWVYGPFKKAMARKHKLIWLGNMLSVHSLLYSHCQSPYWHSMLFGCLLSNGQPLWPDMWTLEDLQADLQEYKDIGMTARWFAEMMNQPVPGSSGLISADEIKYRPMRAPDDIEYGFITIDPAISQKDWANDTAIVAHGFVEDVWQVLEEEHGKFDIGQIWNCAINMCYRWRLNVIGIETGAFQSSLQYIFKYLAMTKNVNNVEIVELRASSQVTKNQRIAAWAAMLKSGDYVLTEGDFHITQQLLNYNPQKRENQDDVIDSAAYGLQMVEKHIGLIMQRHMRTEDVRVLDEYAVCSV